MSKAVLGVVAGVAVVVVGGWYVTSMGSEKEAQMVAEKAAMEEKALMEQKAMEEKAMMEKDAAMMKNDANADTMDKMDEAKASGDMMKDEMMKDDMMKDEVSVGAYLPYEASKLAMANDGDVVLFFRASWCPSCRTLDGDIKANLGAIPAGVTILDVDYDAATALKQKYGVTTQHTLVQVAADGSMITKWSGGSTLASVVAKIQ